MYVYIDIPIYVLMYINIYLYNMRIRENVQACVIHGCLYILIMYTIRDVYTYIHKSSPLTYNNSFRTGRGRQYCWWLLLVSVQGENNLFRRYALEVLICTVAKEIFSAHTHQHEQRRTHHTRKHTHTHIHIHIHIYIHIYIHNTHAHTHTHTHTYTYEGGNCEMLKGLIKWHILAHNSTHRRKVLDPPIHLDPATNCITQFGSHQRNKPFSEPPMCEGLFSDTDSNWTPLQPPYLKVLAGVGFKSSRWLETGRNALMAPKMDYYVGGWQNGV